MIADTPPPALTRHHTPKRPERPLGGSWGIAAHVTYPYAYEGVYTPPAVLLSIDYCGPNGAPPCTP